MIAVVARLQPASVSSQSKEAGQGRGIQASTRGAIGLGSFA